MHIFFLYFLFIYISRDYNFFSYNSFCLKKPYKYKKESHVNQNNIGLNYHISRFFGSVKIIDLWGLHILYLIFFLVVVGENIELFLLGSTIFSL